MSKEHRAIIEMALCAIMWSLSGVLTKLVDWNPFVISAGRSFFAGLVIFLYMKKLGLALALNRKSVLLGVCVASIFALYMPAVKLTTAANAIVLQYTAPVFVLGISALMYKQRVKRADMTAVALTVAGIALCFIDRLGGGSLIGNLLGLASGLFLAGMFIIADRISRTERLSGLFLAQAITVIVGIPFVFTTKITLTGGAIFFVVLQGVVQLGLPYILYTRAVRHCPPLKCSLISVVEPMINPIWVFAAVGERPGQYAVFGIAVVLVTVTVWCIYQEKQRIIEARAVSEEETEEGTYGL